jgi:predicted  nucleic acid-binding Zn-ribbon protein
VTERWEAERVEDESGFKSISIKRDGIYVANMVMSLSDDEWKTAKFIAEACNEKERGE